jgi:hypothetical protein
MLVHHLATKSPVKQEVICLDQHAKNVKRAHIKLVRIQKPPVRLVILASLRMQVLRHATKSPVDQEIISLDQYVKNVQRGLSKLEQIQKRPVRSAI